MSFIISMEVLQHGTMAHVHATAAELCLQASIRITSVLPIPGACWRRMPTACTSVQAGHDEIKDHVRFSIVIEDHVILCLSHDMSFIISMVTVNDAPKDLQIGIGGCEI